MTERKGDTFLNAALVSANCSANRRDCTVDEIQLKIILAVRHIRLPKQTVLSRKAPPLKNERAFLRRLRDVVKFAAL